MTMHSKPQKETEADARRAQVRERYRGFAVAGTQPDGNHPKGEGCGGSGTSSCCGGSSGSSCCGPDRGAIELGYSAEDVEHLPEGANLGLGCGNPTALAALRRGQVVLDLGSGGGIDCFVASKQVGPKGHVIGVDMTPEMVAKARKNAQKGRYRNVEFRLGEIEHLPVADSSVDVVISNCVINLAPDKAPVYREAHRVLRPGGHFAVSDVVATRPISAKDRANPELWSSCSSGALQVAKIRTLLRKAGFSGVEIRPKNEGPTADSLAPQATLGVFPADIVATKPGVRSR